MVAASAWLRRMVTETFNTSLALHIVANFPQFSVLNASKGEHPAIRYASMWRKMMLADRLRQSAEADQGWKYKAVVRTRPDIAYGAAVVLDRLDLSNGEVLYTAHPPAATGAVWRFCSGWDGLNAGSCGQLPSSACIESPLLEDPRTAVLVECPCCSPFRNPFLEELARAPHSFFEGVTHSERGLSFLWCTRSVLA